MAKDWPSTNKDISLDPYKTLFVSNLVLFLFNSKSFDSTEKQLFKTFEAYGNLKNVKAPLNIGENSIRQRRQAERICISGI